MDKRHLITVFRNLRKEFEIEVFDEGWRISEPIAIPEAVRKKIRDYAKANFDNYAYFNINKFMKYKEWSWEFQLEMPY